MSKKTKFVSSKTVLTANFANQIFGGLEGTDDASLLDPDDPLIIGHVHDGKSLDGHAQKIDLENHVTGELDGANIMDASIPASKLVTGGIGDLSDTLAEGNITDGFDIKISTGDKIVGETDLDLESTGASSDINLTPGASGSVVVTGKLTVTGVIDPTGLILEQSPVTDPDLLPSASQGTIYIDDGSLVYQVDTPYYLGASGLTIVPLFGGEHQGVGFSGAGTSNHTIVRGTNYFEGTLTGPGNGTMNATLPPSDTVRGRVIYVKHSGDGSGTLNVLPDGSDTIESGSSYSVTLGNVVGFISDGSGDWVVVTFGGETRKGSWTSPVELSPNSTLNVRYFAPYDIVVTGIKVYANVAPSSAAGTYELTATGDGNTLIDSPPYDLEGLSNDTLTSVSLTGTTADLNLDEGDPVLFTFTSNNADLVGSDLIIQIIFRER